MEPQVSLDCTTCFHSNSIFHKEGASDVNAMSIVQDHVSHQQPGTHNLLFNITNLSNLGLHSRHLSKQKKLFWVSLACYVNDSKKAKAAMGCLDTPRGGKFFQCITSIRKGKPLFLCLTVAFELLSLRILCLRACFVFFFSDRILRISLLGFKVKTRIRLLAFSASL